VEKGDTLNKIASQTKPANVSLEQMLVALYRETSRRSSTTT
jgi:pilus assembly protein FimV